MTSTVAGRAADGAPRRPAGLRVGVIGTGVMGTDHIATLYRSVSGALVTAACDVDPARAALAVADIDGARVHADPLALVADDGVDAVLIASSDQTHEQYVLAAVAAGKPVLCEKPLAPTVEGCLRIIEAEAVLPGRLITVGFMRRYDPGYLALKAVLDAGELGGALMLHCVHRNPAAPPGQPTSVLVTGSAVHEIDLARWLLDDEVVEVSVRHPRRSSLVPGVTQDPLLVLLQMASGALVDVEVFVNAQYGYDVRCELVGERAAASMGDQGGLLVRANGLAGRGIHPDWRGRFADAYRTELRDWVDGAVRGTPAGASAWDGLAAAVVCDAALDALETGRPTPVRLPEKPTIYHA